MKSILTLLALLTLVSCGRRNCSKSTQKAAQKYNNLTCSQQSYDSYCSKDISEQQLDYMSFYSPNCYSVYRSCLGLNDANMRDTRRGRRY